MNHKMIARMLSNNCRALLIEHVDGAVFAKVPVVATEQVEARNALLRRHLIQYGVTADGRAGYGRQKFTYATQDGRLVMAYVLAGYAEALVLAGYRVQPVGQTAIEAFAREAAEQESASVG